MSKRTLLHAQDWHLLPKRKKQAEIPGAIPGWTNTYTPAIAQVFLEVRYTGSTIAPAYNTYLANYTLKF